MGWSGSKMHLGCRIKWVDWQIVRFLDCYIGLLFGCQIGRMVDLSDWQICWIGQAGWWLWVVGLVRRQVGGLLDC